MVNTKRNPRLWKLIVIIVAAGIALAACGGGATPPAEGEAGTGAGGGNKKITIGYITWAEDIAATFLWEHILEERGYDVELTQLAVGPTFKGLTSGDLQLFFDTWLPTTHKQYWEQYGDQLEQLSLWYDNATLEIAVPEYSPLNSIADLKGQAATFDGKIIGIEPGAGLTDITKNQVIPQYGLDGYTLATSSTPAMLAALESATQAKKPIVVTLWHPHWAYDAYPIKDLQDPKGALGAAEKVYVVAPKGFSEQSPEVAGWVSKFKMNDQQLADLENVVVNRAESEEQRRAAVDKWAAANQELVTSWAGPAGAGSGN